MLFLVKLPYICYNICICVVFSAGLSVLFCSVCLWFSRLLQLVRSWSLLWALIALLNIKNTPKIWLEVLFHVLVILITYNCDLSFLSYWLLFLTDWKPWRSLCNLFRKPRRRGDCSSSPLLAQISQRCKDLLLRTFRRAKQLFLCLTSFSLVFFFISADQCIDPWLSRKTSCPVCKCSIT